MDIKAISELIDMLRSKGVSKFSDGPLTVELDLYRDVAPQSILPPTPDHKKQAILDELKDLERHENDLELWSV